MKVIQVNKFMKGYKAITLYPFIFVKKGAKFSDVDLNHENIHGEQVKELLIIFFYIFYIIEFLYKLLKYRNWHKAYRNISFEKEAYNNQNNLDYIKSRKHYNWINLI